MPPIGTTNQLNLLSGPLGFKQGGAPVNVLGYQPAAQPKPDNQGGTYGPSTAPRAAAAPSAAQIGSADDIAFLNDQAAQLRGLLGRTDTSLNQGLTKNQDAFNYQQGAAQAQHDQQTIDENKAKLSAYDTINRNAGDGFRSLSQIIGRAAGTGSSAYQYALPDVIGKDTSSKRMDATNVHGDNLSKIDGSFNSTVADLMRQKKANEEDLRSKVEDQRQTIQQKLAENAGQLAQVKGGGYAQVKAAQAPMQSAIDNSRNAVENFFNDFRTPYTPMDMHPNLAQYNTDRAQINAQAADPSADPTNPYASLLRRKLQGVSA